MVASTEEEFDINSSLNFLKLQIQLVDQTASHLRKIFKLTWSLYTFTEWDNANKSPELFNKICYSESTSDSKAIIKERLPSSTNLNNKRSSNQNPLNSSNSKISMEISLWDLSMLIETIQKVDSTFDLSNFAQGYEGRSRNNCLHSLRMTRNWLAHLPNTKSISDQEYYIRSKRITSDIKGLNESQQALKLWDSTHNCAETRSNKFGLDISARNSSINSIKKPTRAGGDISVEIAAFPAAKLRVEENPTLPIKVKKRSKLDRVLGFMLRLF